MCALWLIFFSLFELRQYLVREQADVFHRHLVRHAAEMKCPGDRGEPHRFAPLEDRIEPTLLSWVGKSFLLAGTAN